MGGIMSFLGVASQVISLAAPYFEQEATYRSEKKQAEAEAVKTQMRIDNELQRAEDEEWKARQAEREAELAQNAGKIAEGEAAEAAYRAKARQRAQLAQSGTLESATGASILKRAESEAQGDQFKIQFNTGKEIEGLLSRADGYRREAGNYRHSASQVAKEAQLRHESKTTSSKTVNILNGLQTAGSILGTVSSVRGEPAPIPAPYPYGMALFAVNGGELGKYFRILKTAAIFQRLRAPAKKLSFANDLTTDRMRSIRGSRAMPWEITCDFCLLAVEYEKYG